MAKKLVPKMERAAQLIAAGVSQISVSAHPDVDVSKQTMNRWCHEEAFQEISSWKSYQPTPLRGGRPHRPPGRRFRAHPFGTPWAGRE